MTLPLKMRKARRWRGNGNVEDEYEQNTNRNTQTHKTLSSDLHYSSLTDVADEYERICASHNMISKMFNPFSLLIHLYLFNFRFLTLFQKCPLFRSFGLSHCLCFSHSGKDTLVAASSPQACLAVLWSNVWKREAWCGEASPEVCSGHISDVWNRWWTRDE